MAKELNNPIHDSILDKLEVGRLDEGHGYVFNVKRNAVSALFIAMLRKALNRSKYNITIRGSHVDRAGLRAKGLNATDSTVPLEIADRLRIYIEGISVPNKSSIVAFEASLATAIKRREKAEKDLAQCMVNDTNKLFEINELKRKNSRLEYDVNEAQLLVRTLTTNYEVDVRNLKAEIKRLQEIITPSPDFAVRCNNSFEKEIVQLLAFKRGYKWAGSLDATQTVKQYSGAFLIFSRVEVDGGKQYRIFHGADHELEMSYNAGNHSDMCKVVELLDNNSPVTLNDAEKKMVAQGNALQAVKSVKDRTGLGLKEAKAVYDEYKKTL